MQAIVFADRLGRDLGPLTDTLCPALLPVAGKALLEYVLEDLADAAVEEVIVVVSANSRQIHERFGDGARWGFVLSYVLSRGEEAPAAVIARLGSRLTAPFLALRGDVLRTPTCRDFLDSAQWLGNPEVNALVDGHPAGVCLVNATGGALADVAWPTPALRNPGAPRIGMAGAALSLIDSPEAFHAANLGAINGRYPGLALAGVERAEGLRVGRMSEVDAKQLISRSASVGDHCVIKPSAKLGGDVVVGDHCYVDSGATLRSSVVLPGTYIGEGLDVSHAIVHGDLLLRVDTGAVLRIVDGELLAPLARQASVPVGDRVAGAVLLALSTPLWPVAAVAALASEPGKPLRRVRLRGNRLARDPVGRAARRTVDSFEWACPVPILRHLPRVWAVVTGDLRLFGARTEALAASADVAPAPSDQDATHYGLLDAALFVPPGAPEEEVELNAIVMAAERGLRARLRRMARGLGLAFTPRAWRPASVTQSNLQHV